MEDGVQLSQPGTPVFRLSWGGQLWKRREHLTLPDSPGLSRACPEIQRTAMEEEGTASPVRHPRTCLVLVSPALVDGGTVSQTSFPGLVRQWEAQPWKKWFNLSVLADTGRLDMEKWAHLPLDGRSCGDQSWKGATGQAWKKRQFPWPDILVSALSWRSQPWKGGTDSPVWHLRK